MNNLSGNCWMELTDLTGFPLMVFIGWLLSCKFENIGCLHCAKIPNGGAWYSGNFDHRTQSASILNTQWRRLVLWKQKNYKKSKYQAIPSLVHKIPKISRIKPLSVTIILERRPIFIKNIRGHPSPLKIPTIHKIQIFSKWSKNKYYFNWCIGSQDRVCRFQIFERFFLENFSDNEHQDL